MSDTTFYLRKEMIRMENDGYLYAIYIDELPLEIEVTDVDETIPTDDE